MSLLVYKIFTHGLNYGLQFERRHAVLVLASDLDLMFNVTYVPKFGTTVKLNFDGRFLPFNEVVASTAVFVIVSGTGVNGFGAS